MDWNKEIAFFTRWYYSKPAEWIRRHDKGAPRYSVIPIATAVMYGLLLLLIPRDLYIIAIPVLFVAFTFSGLLWMAAHSKPKEK